MIEALIENTPVTMADVTAAIAAAAVADGSITLAKLANLANQRVIGRNTAGTGVPEAVTASQLFDWVSNTNGVLLTRTGGTWGTVANVTTDNGDLVMADNAAPAAPSAGTKIYSKNIAGRSMPAFVNNLDRARAAQPFLGQSRVGMWYQASATTFGALNVTGVAIIAGTGTSRPPASTNLCTSIRRVGLVSATTANAIAAISSSTYNWVWRGNAAGLGGFFQVYKFAISDAVLLSTANMFIGLAATNYTDVAPSTLANRIGIGVDSGDTVLQLYASGSSAQTRSAITIVSGPNAGGNFPANTVSTDVYEFTLYAPPNGSNIQWRVERLNTGDVATGTISAAASLPANTQFLTAGLGRSTGTSGTGNAVALDIIGVYFESDN